MGLNAIRIAGWGGCRVSQIELRMERARSSMRTLDGPLFFIIGFTLPACSRVLIVVPSSLPANARTPYNVVLSLAVWCHQANRVVADVRVE